MEDNSLEFDLLKELNNIGSGSAITSLSSLVNEKITFQVPKMKLCDIQNVTSAIKDASEYVIGVLAQIQGEIKGMIMLILNIEAANVLVSALLNTETKQDGNFSDMELSVLSEIGNIMFSSYVTTLNTMTNKNITMSVPFISMDMAGAILSVPATEFSKISDKVIFVEEVFELQGEEVKGQLVMVPDYESYQLLSETMGVEL